ncbi:uncharacterized protein LOC110725087 [Chenopodium quinoa]|uniref:uncharacterized protein LOC110725087 n=1 Tax=Chenopodium quinoa TaxID=63459 RepID=UPI000B792366|nr:uncharacterized protein LOC110725087 [Chenopodium quinoa]
MLPIVYNNTFTTLCNTFWVLLKVSYILVVVCTPEGVIPVRYWVFVRKRNENGDIVRYKARLVAQGFSQRPGIDYEETYSPVVDATTFRFLISLAIREGLDLCLMDVVTTYLYGPLDNDIYMKLPEGFKLPKAVNSVYVDNLNIIGTPEEISMTSIYIEKVLKRFSLDTIYPLSNPMVVRALDVEKDPFRPRENDEEILGPEIPYLSAIGALMHWNGVKHVLRYLQGTKDMDARYMSDPHNARSQTGYVFMCGGNSIFWRSMKQTIAATSSNHAEILAIHEASHECVWLRSVIQHIQKIEA